ncbi:VOC family protein [Terricaulis sp.]|uniref:VOC family protein n=1 Tax=Terricaulis sp. TaxID=2768686 RepID=UPI003783C1A3
MAEAAKKYPGPETQPAVLGGVVPYLEVDGAFKAAAFYENAFGAEVVAAQPPDEKGRTMHIHLYLNGGSFMLVDPYPEHGHPHQPAQGYTLHLKIDGDIDAAFNRAVDAGCTIALPLQDMFWGDRYGQLRDPFGILWSMGQPKN